MSGATVSQATKSPTRCFRLPDETWEALGRIAAKRRVKVSVVVREALDGYAKEQEATS